MLTIDEIGLDMGCVSNGGVLGSDDDLSTGRNYLPHTYV